MFWTLYSIFYSPSSKEFLLKICYECNHKMKHVLWNLHFSWGEESLVEIIIYQRLSTPNILTVSHVSKALHRIPALLQETQRQGLKVADKLWFDVKWQFEHTSIKRRFSNIPQSSTRGHSDVKWRQIYPVFIDLWEHHCGMEDDLKSIK